MEDDMWGVSSSGSSISHRSATTSKYQSGFHMDVEEFVEDEDIAVEYPCPFCSDDYDLIELCHHIDDEHHLEANHGGRLRGKGKLGSVSPSESQESVAYLCFWMGPVKVEARVCETRSQKFKGPCVSENNCANVCQTEGFPDGNCNGILRRCYCNSPC